MAEVVAGRYVLCDPIGTGGSGTVWRAFDRTLQQYCAAKLLRQRDAGELLRFAREQSVRLHHPNIVSPYAWAADDGMVLIASELIDGGSLQVLLGDYGALAEDTVVAILDQLLTALQVVHSAELIHRDVKPGNVLLRATGDGPLQVLLADFGLTISRRDARLTAVGLVIGTPGYLPPEVLAGGASPEPAHDMYAVGRLALALLSGLDVPAAERTGLHIADPVLREMLRALLSVDPAARPGSAQEARSGLLGARRSEVPQTRDGDPITVLDQLPPLPDGWDDAGEVSTAEQAPRTASAGRPAPARRPTVVDAARSADAAQFVDNAPPDADEGRPESTAAAIRGSTLAGGGAPTGRAARRFRRTVVAVVVGLLAVVAGGVFAVLQLRGEDPGPGTEAPGSTVGTPPASDGATGNTDPDLRAGDACDWQVEGDRRNSVDGVLVCTIDGGDYRWVLAPG